MSRKGSSRHLNRMASSRYMRVEKKSSKYIAKPTLGRHTLQSSMALITALKEKMNIGKSAYEIRSVIKKGKVKVNGKIVKNDRYAIGLEDTIEIVPTGELYRVGINNRGSISIEKAADGKQLFKVVGKYIYRGNRQMLRLHNGTVIAATKDAKVNDSVQLADKKIEKVIRLEEGAACRIISGVHSSKSGKIVGIKGGTFNREPTVEIESRDGRIETVLRNIIVTGA